MLMELDNQAVKVDLGKECGYKFDKWSVCRRKDIAVAVGYKTGSCIINYMLVDLKSMKALHQVAVTSKVLRAESVSDHHKILEVKNRVFVVSLRCMDYCDLLEVINGQLLSNFDSMHPICLKRPKDFNFIPNIMVEHPTRKDVLLVGGNSALANLTIVCS